MSPDQICEKYAAKRVKIKIYEKESTVFVEGSSEALEFVGNLFLAQARFKKDHGFQISPTGAGKIFFSPASTRGLYIHLMPKNARALKKRLT